MKIIILAAGRGSRMGERTNNLPKCMCKLLGKSLLVRCLETLEKANIKKEDIGIVTGYMKDKITIDGVTYFHNEDWSTTNMFISLTKAHSWLENDVCIVCYSDIVFTPDCIIKLVTCNEDMALTYYTEYWDLWSKRMDNPLDDLESFHLSEDKKYLKRIGKKAINRDEIEGQYMGIIKFTPKSWSWVQSVISKPLSKSIEKLDMTTLLDAIISEGHNIFAIPICNFWLECDTDNDIKLYEHIYKEKIKEL